MLLLKFLYLYYINTIYPLQLLLVNSQFLNIFNIFNSSVIKLLCVNLFNKNDFLLMHYEISLNFSHFLVLINLIKLFFVLITSFFYLKIFYYKYFFYKFFIYKIINCYLFNEFFDSLNNLLNNYEFNNYFYLISIIFFIILLIHALLGLYNIFIDYVQKTRQGWGSIMFYIIIWLLLFLLGFIYFYNFIYILTL